MGLGAAAMGGGIVTDVQMRARQITAIVAATIQILAEQGLTEPEPYALAQHIGADWDDACCPFCEETLCDDGCPLAGIRAAQRHAQTARRDRRTIETNQTGDPQRVHVRVLLTVGDRAEPDLPLRSEMIRP